MSASALRTAIKNKVAGVSGVANVYDYMRFASHQTAFETLFKSGTTLHGWMVTRRTMPSSVDTRDTTIRAHGFKIIGLYGVDDATASEKTFDGLVEAICNAFDADADLGGLVHVSAPAQVAVIEHRMFFGNLCHYAEIDLQPKEQVSFSL